MKAKHTEEVLELKSQNTSQPKLYQRNKKTIGNQYYSLRAWNLIYNSKLDEPKDKLIQKS